MMIVETGEGLPDANSYADVDFVDAYHLERGHATWTGDDKEAAIIRATQALDGNYKGRLPGKRSKADQALEWPRTQAWDADGYALVGIPKALKMATAEAALVELTTPGAFTVQGSVGEKRVKIGPIEVENFEKQGAIKTYPSISQHMGRLVRGGGNLVIRRA